MPTSSFGKKFVLNEKETDRLVEAMEDPNFGVDLPADFKSRLTNIEEVREMLGKALGVESNEKI